MIIIKKDQIRSAIRRYVESSLQVQGFQNDDDLVVLGLESVQAAELASFIERTYSIALSRDDRARLRTLNAIADYVHRQTRSGR